NTAIIVNNYVALAGFTGNITGLLNVAASGGGAPIQLGFPTQGLNTALADITLSSNEMFTAWMTAAALRGAADAARVTVVGVTAVANLNVVGAVANVYETLTVNSVGTGPNDLTLNTNGKSTATIIETGAQDINLLGTALNIANLHRYNGSAGT